MRQRGGSSKTRETFLQTTALPGDIRSFESIDTSASKELDSKGFIFFYLTRDAGQGTAVLGTEITPR